MVPEQRSTGIKSLPPEDRPREKLIQRSAQALTDAEILAIIISTGTRQKTAIDLARELLALADNNINILADFSLTQLMQVKGIGKAKAITIAAALELTKRKMAANKLKGERRKITSSREIYDYLASELTDQSQEYFYIILLDRGHKIIKHQQISIGGMTGTVVDPKVIFEKALKEKATALILVHNHPSGNKQPSDADISLTKKIIQAAGHLEISVLDHIIFTDNGYFSFADEGLIN